MKSLIFILSGLLAAVINDEIVTEGHIEKVIEGSAEVVVVGFSEVEGVTETILEATETVLPHKIAVLWIILGTAATIALCIIAYFIFIYCARNNIVEPNIPMNRRSTVQSKAFSVTGAGLVPDE